jgi:hypothetical protein
MMQVTPPIGALAFDLRPGRVYWSYDFPIESISPVGDAPVFV